MAPLRCSVLSIERPRGLSTSTARLCSGSHNNPLRYGYRRLKASPQDDETHDALEVSETPLTRRESLLRNVVSPRDNNTYTLNAQQCLGVLPVNAHSCCRTSTCRPRLKWYDRYIAYSFSHCGLDYNDWLHPYKESLFKTLSGDQGDQILEVGIGIGVNFEFYTKRTPGATIVGLDPNPEMRHYAEASAEKSKVTDFQFVNGYGEAMPFTDNSFDAVVATCVLCSVPDVPATLNEIRRVLKPGGQFLFLEHVIAPPGTPSRLLQTIFNPLQQILVDGCHLTRDTLNTIENSNFIDLEASLFDVEQAGFLSTHISGSATVETDV